MVSGARTEGVKGARKTTMIVALARKLLIALWRMVTTGEVPAGVSLRPVSLTADSPDAEPEGAETQVSAPGALSRPAADDDPRWR